MHFILVLRAWEWDLQGKCSGCMFQNLPSNVNLLASYVVIKTAFPDSHLPLTVHQSIY